MIHDLWSEVLSGPPDSEQLVSLIGLTDLTPTQSQFVQWVLSSLRVWSVGLRTLYEKGISRLQILNGVYFGHIQMF